MDMEKLYKVTKAVWGADKPEELFFKTKEEADAFYEVSDYVDKPVKVTMEKEKAQKAIFNTECEMEQY